MPAPRKKVVIGRSSGIDRAGRPLAEQEKIERWIRRAKSVGIPDDVIEDFYRDGIEMVFDLCPPKNLEELEELGVLEDAIHLGLTENGLPQETKEGKPLVPDNYRFYELQRRTWANRGEDWDNRA
jgi:hypothetical protein